MQKVRRKIAVGMLAALVLALAMAATVGGTERRLPACPDGSVCLWKSPSPNEDSKRYVVKGAGVTNLPHKFNNKVSIAYNGRGRIAILHAGRNGNGDSRCVPPMDSSGDLSGVDFDNKTSSVRLSRNATACPS
jgi:hypothetical protein